MAVTQLPDGRWVVYYRSNKRVIKEYFGRGPEAEAAAKARNAALPKAPRKRARPVTGPTFGELAREYARAHQFASPRARDQHLIRMTSRLLPFFGARPALRISDDDIDRYVRERRSAGVAYSTIRRELVDFKAIVNFAARRRPPLIPYNPIRDYRIPAEDLAVIMPPTAEEFAAILRVAPEHLRRIMLLSYYLGLRPGPVECYRLRWENVDWTAGTILVIGAKKGGPDRRSVPIHPIWPQHCAAGMHWIRPEASPGWCTGAESHPPGSRPRGRQRSPRPGSSAGYGPTTSVIYLSPRRLNAGRT